MSAKTVGKQWEDKLFIFPQINLGYEFEIFQEIYQEIVENKCFYFSSFEEDLKKYFRGQVPTVPSS
jgi:hypothetical protein